MHDEIPQGKRIIVWRKNYLNVRRKKGFRTICEVMREVYLAAEERGDAVTMTKMDEASDMAKRMQKRLEEYAGGKRTALIHFETGFAWINKDRMFHLTDAEVKLIESKRAKAAAKAAAEVS